jgi:3-oxoadipate enol-lactonase
VLPTLHVHEDGRGPAVLVLPGCGTPSDVLMPLARSLARSHRVLLPDLPGYGRSPRLAPDATLADVQAAVERAALARGAAAPALVGWSLGAYHALALALRRRIRPTRLALLAPIAAFPETERAGILALAAAMRSGADVGDAFVARMLSPAFAAAHPRVCADVRSWQRRACPADVLAQDLEAFARSDDLRPRLPSIAVPVAIRVGADDAACPVAVAQDIAGRLPGARTTVVPAVGHALFHEDAAASTHWVTCALDEGS